MPTPSKPWPENVKEHRDRAAEECVKAHRNVLAVLVTDQMTYDELLRRLALADDALLTALRHLEQAGAPTRPQ